MWFGKFQTNVQGQYQSKSTISDRYELHPHLTKPHNTHNSHKQYSQSQSPNILNNSLTLTKQTNTQHTYMDIFLHKNLTNHCLNKSTYVLLRIFSSSHVEGPLGKSRQTFCNNSYL